MMRYHGAHRAEDNGEPSKRGLHRTFAAAFVACLLVVVSAGTANAGVSAEVQSSTSKASYVVYTRIISGTTLWGTASRYCGNGNLWYTITYTNGVHPSPTNLVIGWTLRVPCSLTSGTTTSTPSSGMVRPYVYLYRCGGYRTAARPHHNGVDIMAPWGTPIRTVANGRVSLKKWGERSGYYVVIDHGSWNTVYMHMKAHSYLPVGAYVRASNTIGYTGRTGNATGPHVHFEVQVDPMWRTPWTTGGDSYRNPINWMAARGVRLC